MCLRDVRALVGDIVKRAWTWMTKPRFSWLEMAWMTAISIAILALR